MKNPHLVAKQVWKDEDLCGKTIKNIDDNDSVIIVFTDNTFLIVDPNPEDDGCGVCCDAWWRENQEFCDRLERLLN